MDHARVLFDDLIAPGTPDDRWGRVHALVTDAKAESLWLDFKTCDHGKDPATDPFIRDGFARALSGFANMEGGLLIYGIKTPPKSASAKGVPDAAVGVAPLKEPQLFRARLEKLARRLVNPPIVGLSVEEVVDPATGGGVVLVFIPASTGGPHRVVEAGTEINDRYFVRTATDHIVMPHAQLADRFGRTARPQLRVELRLQARDRPWARLVVINEGRGTAERPAVQVIAPPDAIAMPRIGDMANGFTITRSVGPDGKRWYLVESIHPLVVYPGMEREFFDVQLRIGGPEIPKIEVDCVAHALGMQPVRRLVELNSTARPPA